MKAKRWMAAREWSLKELNAALSRIETFVECGGWLGANWPLYPELAIPAGRVYEVSLAIPEWVWIESDRNFQYDADYGAEE